MFCVRGVIICLRAIPCIVERLRAVTGYSESVILSDMVGTSRHTATIRPTEQEHPTRTPERALLYRNRDGIPLYHSPSDSGHPTGIHEIGLFWDDYVRGCNYMPEGYSVHCGALWTVYGLF